MALPDVYFGDIAAEPLDWRAYKDDDPDDDEEMERTLPSVVKLLGFDPLEFKDER